MLTSDDRRLTTGVLRAVSLVGVGLVLRVLVIVYLVHVKPNALSWGINEAGGIARWIVLNHSFSTPFHDAAGPTAWLGPGYPALVALSFLIFGVATPASALAMMIFNAICSALTGWVVYLIARRAVDERAGLIAGWLWALSPYVMLMPFLLWDTSLSALLLGYGFLRTLELNDGRAGDSTIRHSTSFDSTSFNSRILDSAACGAAWGVAGLVSPALLIPLPFLLAYLGIGKRRWMPPAIVAGAAFLVLMPWLVRDFVVFHRLLPVRSNGLAEVYFGNLGFEMHPLGPSMEYQRLGETAFVSRYGSLALQYIAQHPGKFVRDSMHRAVDFWTQPSGFLPLNLLIELAALAALAVLFRRTPFPAMPFLVVLGTYPLLYYASQAFTRFRHPIEPLLYALAGCLFSQLGKGARAGWLTKQSSFKGAVQVERVP